MLDNSAEFMLYYLYEFSRILADKKMRRAALERPRRMAAASMSSRHGNDYLRGGTKTKMEIEMIHNSSDIPVDSTYFRVAGAEPDINADGSITIYNATGAHRSWGRPQVNSTIIVEANDFVAIHVGFSHKHGGGQFWRYYYILNGKTKHVTWSALADETRQIVLDAAAKKAPSWAKSPGNLRSNYRKPKDNAFGGYKVVRIAADGSLRGLYNPDVVYQVGKVMIEKARPDHNGGYYTYVDADVEAAFRRGDISGKPAPGRYAVLQCTCWGSRYFYDRAGRQTDQPTYKVSTTYCRPDSIVGTFQIA